MLLLEYHLFKTWKMTKCHDAFYFYSIPSLHIWNALLSPSTGIDGKTLRLKFSERNVNEPETPKEDVSESQSEES